MKDLYDIIRGMLPDTDLKFRIEKKGTKEISVIVCKEMVTAIYAPIVNTLQNKGNDVGVSLDENTLCFDITFKDENAAKDFAESYLSQGFKDASKVAIIDNQTRMIVCAGYVRNVKHSDPIHNELMLISIDGAYYFHLYDSLKYHIEWYNGETIPFTNEMGYNILQWQKSPCTDPSTVDVYRDFSYTELDPEVKPLVHAMNKIPGVYTTGSCCGHNIRPMYISFSVSQIEALCILEKCLSKENSGYYKVFRLDVPIEHDVKYNSPLKKEFTLDGRQIKTASILNADRPGGQIQVTLISRTTGEQTYKAASLFADDICKIVEGKE